MGLRPVLSIHATRNYVHGRKKQKAPLSKEPFETVSLGRSLFFESAVLRSLGLDCLADLDLNRDLPPSKLNGQRHH